VTAAFYREPRDSRLPAILAAVALHGALLALLLVAPVKPPPMLPVGSSVPITIVSSATVTDTRPAVQAPETQTAAAPEPTPAAPPQAPAPKVEPTPAFTPTPPPARPKPERPRPTPPPQPSLHPTPTPRTPPAPPQPAARPTPAQRPIDFNHLQSIIDNARRASGNPASSAQRGPARAETAPQARPDAGRGVSQSDLLGLQQLLERLWRPNCDAPGVDTLKVKVRFTVGLNGNLLGPSGRQVTVIGREGSSLSGLAPDELRAVDSVHRAEPFAEPYYGQTIVVNFDAKEACSNR